MKDKRINYTETAVVTEQLNYKIIGHGQSLATCNITGEFDMVQY